MDDSEVVHSAVDVPDERDVPYEALFGVETPERVIFPAKLIIQNQGAQAITRMACSRFAMAHIVNAQTLITDNTQTLSGIELWKRFLVTHPGAEESGASLQSALNQAVKEGLIAGYATISDIESAKQAIDRGHFIYSGSFNGNWSTVREKDLYSLRTDGRVVGHIYMYAAYDDRGFIDINSYGEDNGYFIFPYDLFDTTFTKYAIVPKKEISPFIVYRQRIMSEIKIEAAKTAFENSLWNGERPDETATRQEVFAGIQRAIDFIKAGK